MGQAVELKALDGHQLNGYIAMPEGEPVGALVVVQEIFGVNLSNPRGRPTPMRRTGLWRLRRRCSIGMREALNWATGQEI